MIVRASSFLFMILSLLTFSGCVGTVEEAVPPDTLKIVNPPTTFTFAGITTARAVSHSRVELEFFPAGGGSEISYELYVNNSITPIPVDPGSLLTVSGGRLLYTVENLLTDREYKFKLTAKNTRTGAISTNEAVAYARTFDNLVANFQGISKLSLVPGDTDNSIKIDWIAPIMSGVFTAGPYDPVNYEITIISEIGGTGNLNNPMYTGSDKKTVLVPTPPATANPLSNPSTTVIDGLNPNTQYFVQVRAINTLYRSYQLDPMITYIPVNREMNTRFLSIKTDGSGSLFDFRQDNVVLSNAKGSDAFDKIDIFWQPGSGSFTGYRVFVRKHDGIGDPSIDKLTDPVLTSMNSLGDYYPVSASFTTKRVTGLENGAFYQVKVALCKTIACPVNQSSGNAAIMSDVKVIQIKSTLAGFSGINSIEPPGQYSEKDVVRLRFDAPLVNDGFATEVEFYCVDPLNHSNMVKINSSPLVGSPITRCEGVYLDGAAGALASFTGQKVRGLITDGTKEYCFAATPAIIGYGPDVRLAVADRIVRCSYPEVFPPSVAQFPGLSGTCGVSATSGVVNWQLPSGGIYSGFKVFWKEKNNADKFSFPSAITGGAGYTSSPVLSASAQTYTATNLIPGRAYQIGVLAFVDLDAPSTDLYSEYNLKILDCVVPLPVATFSGFSRIFAIGPKYDGRIPNDIASKAPSPNSSLYEAINADGTPFEVAMDSPTAPNTLLNYTPPPGRDFGATFTGNFDGARDDSVGMAISKNGIISLAWEDVRMSFSEADTLFASNQPASPALRTGRTWGYRVFRSSDNMLTWREMTSVSGPIYSTNYSYRKRPNGSLIATKMAFFTDYSVKSLQETHDPATGQDVERARTYHYRIVPLFDGKPLTYSRPRDHIVRVTLPPPNMALVHRWMANRARCMEIDKDPVIAENYSCEYNGLGSRAKSIPFRVGATILDQGGDLLIDRFELGCRYTRGDKVAVPEVGASYFNVLTKRDNDDRTIFPAFQGFRTVGTTVDTSTPFKGCVGFHSVSKGFTGTAADLPVGFSADYAHVLQGDCVGRHFESITYNTCSALAYSNLQISPIAIVAPGSPTNSMSVPDCSDDRPNDPKTIQTKYMGYLASDNLMQSEFLAVFYNTTSLTGRLPPVEGPATGSLSATGNLSTGWSVSSTSSQCSINLAAIDGSGFMKPRWLSVNELGGTRTKFKNSYPNLLDKTVNEVTEVAAQTVEPLTFYNGTEGDITSAAWKLPSPALRNSNRYRSTTKLGKIMYSNSSKLPPLGRLNAEVAKNVCNTFYVQTGLASDNGNFSPDSRPIQKRPLRRIESVAASAWPDTFDTTQVTSIESSNSAGSCNSTAKGVSGNWYSKGANLSNMPLMNGVNMPLITGSSNFVYTSLETDTRHTSRCVSRYGIQDMVGNVMENNSEKFFCDYSQDSIFLGPVSSTWSGGTAAIRAGDGGPDYSFFNDNSQRSEWAVLKSGNLANGSPEIFRLKFRDGSPERTDIKPWVNINVDSGYCSPVDTNPLRRDGAVDIFKDVATGFWSPIYRPGGALNTTMIARPQSDQDSVATLRNGDGRFLDFGPRGIAAPMNTANTLALSGTTAISKYFNPILGMPLLCENGACNDPILPDPNDNTAITTAALAANITGADDAPSVTDFWVGNSQIMNRGISDFSYSSAGFDTTTAPISGGYTGGPVYYLTSVLVDDPVTMGNPVQEIKNFPADFQLGSTIEYYRVVWDLERGAEFAMASGGKSNEPRSGRYTASFNGSTIGPNLLSSGTDDIASGARCAVLINQDP